MDENEYRNAYQGINPVRCVFEKSILTQNCGCSLHHKFNLAEREGVQCNNEQAQQRCKSFLDLLRPKARFALKLTDIVGNLLPHNKEIQVQKGSLLGLLPELPNLPETRVEDINQILEEQYKSCGEDWQNLQLEPLIQSILHHPPRKRSRRSRNKTQS